FLPSTRFVGWYMVSEMITGPWRVDGPTGSGGGRTKEISSGIESSVNVRCVFARMVFGVVERSRTLFTVSVYVVFVAIGVVVRITVLVSVPNAADRTVTPLSIV